MKLMRIKRRSSRTELRHCPLRKPVQIRVGPVAVARRNLRPYSVGNVPGDGDEDNKFPSVIWTVKPNSACPPGPIPGGLPRAEKGKCAVFSME
jgi:hypothetical protein